GVTDIIYLKGDGVYIYLNESGNRWADAEKLESFPHIDNLSSVMAVDLLSNGTAYLVWSSPLPGHVHKPMRYIDLMGGQKPHLLIKTVNNLGAETHIHYVPSTKFYLADKEAGKPWSSRIPFPVHVIERVESYDRISRNRFVTQYAYHHGYFDGVDTGTGPARAPCCRVSGNPVRCLCAGQVVYSVKNCCLKLTFCVSVSPCGFTSTVKRRVSSWVIGNSPI
ncbi:MAG: hypothetical protein JSU62_08450, partial [Gammaproteobacteria bacterium]